MPLSLDQLVSRLVPGATVGRGIIPVKNTHRTVMQITKEDLEAERSNLETQSRQARDLLMQATGAIAVINTLLARLETSDEAESPQDKETEHAEENR